MGFPKARILEWVVFPFSRGCSWSRDWSRISWVADSLLHCRRIPYPLSHMGILNFFLLIDVYSLCLFAHQFSSVQLLTRVQLFATPGIAAFQASLSITNSQSSIRLKSIGSVMLSSHLILCRTLLLLPSIPPSIRVFSNESTLRMRWPKYWTFSFSIIPSTEIPGLISFRMDWLDKYICTQHGSTAVCKTNANKYERRN